MNLGSVHGSVHGFVHGLVHDLVYGYVFLEHGGLPFFSLQGPP